jgi:hypothetical protein
VTTVNELISSGNIDKAILQGLIAQNQSETVIADPGTNAPSLVSGTINEWLLVQNTPDSGTGLYIGSYKLNSANACSVIDILSVSGYTAPGDGIGARAQACGSSGVWSDLAHVNDLENKQVKAFVIRSSTPFTVTLRLAAKWCYSIDFAQGKGITDVYLVGNWQAGEGYNAVCFGVISGFSTQPYNVALAISAPLAGTRLTSVSMTYNAQPKSATAYVATIRRDSLSNIIKQQPIGSGTDKIIIWTGDAVFNSLILSIGLSNGPNPADCNLTSYNGRIKTLTVKGTGACPFGAPTCTP